MKNFVATATAVIYHDDGYHSVNQLRSIEFEAENKEDATYRSRCAYAQMLDAVPCDLYVDVQEV